MRKCYQLNTDDLKEIIKAHFSNKKNEKVVGIEFKSRISRNPHTGWGNDGTPYLDETLVIIQEGDDNANESKERPAGSKGSCCAG